MQETTRAQKPTPLLLVIAQQLIHHSGARTTLPPLYLKNLAVPKSFHQRKHTIIHENESILIFKALTTQTIY